MRFYTEPQRRVHELYALVFPNGKRYIGISVNAANRWTEHKAKARAGSDLPVHCAIRKYGSENVERRVLAIGDRAYIAQLEVAAIQMFGTRSRGAGYNVTIGGDISPMHTPEVRAAITGRRFSQQHRASMSAAARERGMSGAVIEAGAAARRGKPLSDAHKQKLSMIRSGRKHSADHVANIAAANRGKKRSPEAIARITEANRKAAAERIMRNRGLAP